MESLSRKSIVVLVILGSVIGIGLGGGLGYGVLSYMRSQNDDFGVSQEVTAEGAGFESLEDLRRAMLSRDERDLKGDKSVSLRALVQPHNSDEIIYTLRPNIEVKFQGVPVTTNSFGMRSPERSVEKAPGTYRIALLGDSFAFGWGVEADKIFAKVLEDRLNQASEGRLKVEVLNFGVPGYSTFQEVAQFLETGIQFSPDAVLIYFVENDFGMPFFVRDFSEAEKALAPSSGFEKMRAKVKTEGDAESKKRMQYLLSLADANHAIIKLHKELASREIPLYLTINPRNKWKKDEHRLWVLKQIPEIRHLKLRDGFMEIFNSEKLTVPDIKLPGDAHPNAKMHSMLGELLAKEFYPEVQKRVRDLSGS